MNLSFGESQERQRVVTDASVTGSAPGRESGLERGDGEAESLPVVSELVTKYPGREALALG
jgi:hypothetical protein